MLMMMLSSCFMENVFYVIQHFVYTCWQAKDYEKLLSKLLFKRNLIFFCKEEDFSKIQTLRAVMLKNGSNH